MLIAALLMALAIVCAYSYVAYKIKTSQPKVGSDVPKSHYTVHVPSNEE